MTYMGIGTTDDSQSQSSCISSDTLLTTCQSQVFYLYHLYRQSKRSINSPDFVASESLARKVVGTKSTIIVTLGVGLQLGTAQGGWLGDTNV